MILDSHVHVLDHEREAYSWLEPDMVALHEQCGLAELRAAHGELSNVQSVLVQATNTESETLQLLALAAADESVCGVVGWVDLASPAVGDRLEELAESRGPLVGVRWRPEQFTDSDWLADRMLDPGFSHLQDAGLAYDLLVNVGTDDVGDLPARWPGIRFVIDHLGLPMFAPDRGAWRAGLARLAEHPNVYCKISGLAMFDSDDDANAAIAVALDLFGPDRCMFGSDWPVSELAARYNDVVSRAQRAISALPAAFQAQVLEGTARCAYRLVFRPAGVHE